MSAIIEAIAGAYVLVIIVAVCLSWFQLDPYHPVVQFVRRATEPLFARIREFVPPLGGLDLSPLIALLLVTVAKKLLIFIVTL